jgi:uncharacterized protein YdaU (DUF1376 family)
MRNAEVGAYVRLLASYWDNNGLPFNQRALTRIAKIEAGDEVDLGEILGEFFIAKDGILYHEEMDVLRIEAMGEEDANRRRTVPARLALAGQRSSVTVPVTETEVEVDVEEDSETEPKSERDSHSEEESDAHEDAERRQVAVDSGSQTPVQTTPTSWHQSVNLKPDGRAQNGAVPAVSSAQSRVIFRLKDGTDIPLSALTDETQLSDTALTTLKQLAERFESIPETRVTANHLPSVMRQWLQPSREAA